MYEELIQRLREKAGAFDYDGRPDIACDYEQSADAIERLIAFNAMWQGAAEFAKENKPKWIPVMERLPEKEQCYLVVLNNRTVDFCFYTKRCGFGMYLAKKWEGANDEVTHWMPLPEPPKEEK